MKRLILSVVLIVGVLFVVFNVYSPGGGNTATSSVSTPAPTPDTLTPSTLPPCEVGQTMGVGCQPQEVVDLGESTKESEDAVKKLQDGS